MKYPVNMNLPSDTSDYSENRISGSCAPEMADFCAAKKSSQLITVTVNDDVPIAIRLFSDEASLTPVIMLHGLQSHSEWFSQSARFISRLGHPVYSMDRRGSGLSSAPRGDIKRFGQMIDDIRIVQQYVRKKHGTDKIHLFGHCFGAIPALATACRYPDGILSLVLTSPGVFTYTDLSLHSKVLVMASRLSSRNPYIPVPLQPEDFTDIPGYQVFIAHDPLALREATARFWFAIHEMRDYIKSRKEKLDLPIFAAFAARDRVSKTSENYGFLCRLPSPAKWFMTYEQSLHILEFGEDRDIFFRDLELWLKRWHQ